MPDLVTMHGIHLPPWQQTRIRSASERGAVFDASPTNLCRIKLAALRNVTDGTKCAPAEAHCCASADASGNSQRILITGRAPCQNRQEMPTVGADLSWLDAIGPEIARDCVSHAIRDRPRVHAKSLHHHRHQCRLSSSQRPHTRARKKT